MNPISQNNFVTGYFEDNHPAFLLIPFTSEDIFNNATIANKYKFDLKKLLHNRYPDKYIAITSSGRKALDVALREMTAHKKERSTVRIQTTTDNFYVSGCVTQTIEKKHSWHRKLEDECDLVLVNHEFGYMDNRLVEERRSTTNVIEDCAFSFDSKFANEKRCGAIAPCAIFSFPKYFPIQLGGCLLSNKPVEENENEEVSNYIENVVGYYFSRIDEWTERRLNAKKYYNEVFGQLGCTPVFDKASDNDVPGVYLFDLPEHVDGRELKDYYQARGIQCSVFYGRQAFYLPLNQFTTYAHIELFAELFRSFQLNRHE